MAKFASAKTISYNNTKKASKLAKMKKLVLS